VLTVALHFSPLQNEDKSNERETKPEESAKDDGKRTMENLKLENVDEKSASGEDKQSVAEKGDLKELEEKSVAKEGKMSVSQKGDSARHEVVDKDLLQVLFAAVHNRLNESPMKV
jgi:hypothetical protein